jgi:uncharacterized metal-binding protein
MVIEIYTFVDVRAVSFPADLFSFLFITGTLSRLSLLGSLLCCFSAVLARALEAVQVGALPAVEVGYRVDQYTFE